MIELFTQAIAEVTATAAAAPDISVGESVWVALIVAVSSMWGPILMSWITARHARQDRAQDFARQDEVARKASEVAQRLADAQREAAEKAAEAAALLLHSNAKAVQATERVDAKLDVIHTLVNSNMTTALKAEYDAMVRELALMFEIVALNKANGREASVEALAAIDATKAKISELRTALADRAAATEAAKNIKP